MKLNSPTKQSPMGSTPTTKELAEQIAKQIIPLYKEVLTTSEAALYLGVTVGHLHKLTMKSVRAIPHYQPNGKMMYFKKSDLDAYMLSNKIATMDEIAQNAAVNQSKKGGRA